MKTAKKHILAGTLALGLVLPLAACATAEPTPSDDTGGLPAEVTIDLMSGLSGLAQPYSEAMVAGWNLRIKEANENAELGDVTITTNVLDEQSDAKVATGLMTELVQSDAVLVAYGTSSSVAPAIAPIAQDAGVPFVAMYAGTPDLTGIGDHVFRVTAPQDTYHHLQNEYFQEQGVKRVAVIYNNDIGTLKSLAEGYYPEAAANYGYEIVRSTGVSVGATDISAEMTGIIGDNPDAVLMLVLGQQNTSVVTQLKRAGYTGIIAGQPGIGLQTLEALGADADGVIYPVDFSSGTTAAKGAAFVEAFTAEYGDAPDGFAASGYEGASLIVAALAEAEAFTRDAVLAALTAVTDRGFDGVTGAIKFENRDARVPGLLVEWRDGKENVIR